jgi:hypothetical protein
MKLTEHIRSWYEGEFIPYKNTPGSVVEIIGGQQVYAPSARIARWLVSHLKREWKWWSGTVLTCLGLLIAYLALLKGDERESDPPSTGTIEAPALLNRTPTPALPLIEAKEQNAKKTCNLRAKIS